MTSWVKATLGDVCHVYQPQTLAQKQLRPGPFPVYGANGQIGWHDEFNHEDSQLLLGCRGSVGTVHVTDGRCWINGNAMVVAPAEGIIERDFLAYALKGGVAISSAITGAAQPQITRTSLNPIPISYPNDRVEQRRLVTLLDEAFAYISTSKVNVEKNLQNTRELFTSCLQSVFSKKGPNWVVQPLGDIGKVSMCKRIFKEQTTPTGDIPFYKIGTFGKQPDAFIPAEIYHQFRQKYPFPNKGDVLVSAAGTVGRCVVYDGEDAYFQDSNIVWIANDQTKLLNHFLYHFYSACDWNSTKGATISRLYNDNLRQIVIAYPKSLDEQNRIAAQLDVLSEKTNQLTDIFRQKLTALEDLKNSLLHQAFSGQL